MCTESAHHWDIAQANGRHSLVVCINCKEERLFANSFWKDNEQWSESNMAMYVSPDFEPAKLVHPQDFEREALNENRKVSNRSRNNKGQFKTG